MVVIPALNEQDCIGEVVAEVRTFLPGATIAVIDDGSTDATRVRAAKAGATVLSLPFNVGVGGALRLGLRYAQRTGHDIVVQVDGDGQHDPSDIAELLEALEGADLVIGARFAGRGGYTATGPRRWAMRGLSAALSLIAKTRLTDVTSGFRAFGPRAVDLLAIAMPAEYLGDTVDALVLCSKAELVITQRPVGMRPRQGGTPSQSPATSALYLARAALALLLTSLRRSHPVSLGEPPWESPS